MVDTTNYDKLKNLLDMPRQPLGAEDMTENTQVGEAHGKVDSAHSNAQAFISDETVGTSQTRAGANSWMSSYIGDVNKHLGKIKSTKVHNLTVRESMHTQAAKGKELSPVLLSESDIAESKRTPPLTLTSDDGKVVEYVTPEAYLAALEEQKNAKREAAAKEILAQIDKEAYAEKNSIFVPKEDYVPGPWQPQPDPGPTPPAPSPAYSGGSRGLVPTVRSGTGAGGEWTSPAPGELGSASNPISDPADLARYDLTTTPVNQRMTPNGPVGGHMPADVLNVNDPAWRPVPSSGGGARIAGGVLVAGSAAGAAGAALSRGGGFAGIGGLASGASGSALRAVAPAGGVLRPSALPGGGVAGSAGGVAGRGGGVGTVGGRGATGGVAGRGTSGAGAVGRGGVAPVGSGASGTAGGRGATGGVAGRGGVSAAGRGTSGVGAVGRGGVAPVGSGASGTAGGRGATGGVAGRGGVSAAGRGASGVGAVGRGGVAGGRGASGVTTVGRGGVAGGRATSGVGAVGRGGVAPVGSGGVGDRREKKGQVQRRAYDVVRVDALEERGAQMMGGAAGSADQLKPIARDADADW